MNLKEHFVNVQQQSKNADDYKMYVKSKENIVFLVQFNVCLILFFDTESYLQA